MHDVQHRMQNEAGFPFLHFGTFSSLQLVCPENRKCILHFVKRIYFMCCICGSNKEKRGILKFETKEKPLHAKYSQSIGNFEGSDPVSNYTHFTILGLQVVRACGKSQSACILKF